MPEALTPEALKRIHAQLEAVRESEALKRERESHHPQSYSREDSDKLARFYRGEIETHQAEISRRQGAISKLEALLSDL